MTIKKISENIFEIEKEGKMLVPGVIFASDLLFDKIKNDKTLDQVKNVAQLPGIVEKSIAMPDVHVGYGFPVGGVAAFDLETGIISPGGIGYDINCLTGDSKILTEFGSSIKIESFDSIKEEMEIEQNTLKIKKLTFDMNLQTLNISNREVEYKEIDLYMHKESKDICELTLNSGLKIKATLDHPFLTKAGMKNLSELKESDELAVNLFEGIEEKEEINKKLAITTKILGYMFGDGCCYRSGKKLFGSAYGTKEDLRVIKKDLSILNVSSSIYSRKRKHKIRTRYEFREFETTNHELHIHSQEFLKTLRNLNMPLGNKTRQEIRVPNWIKKAPLTYKRLFLAGFFGAEMSSPKTSSKTCFMCPTIDQNKIEVLSQNARDFLIDLSLMLEEFGVKNTRVREMDDYKNKYEEKTRRFRLIISSEEDMLKLWRTIGFEYNKKRQNLANLSSLYILLKKKENEKRVVISKKIKEYKNKGFRINEVKRIFLSEINERFIERHYYEKAGQRINLNFISFKDFCKEKLQELESFGCIFDKISKIEKLEGKHKVYDFNIRDNHNFIANSFIVSNCGVRLLTTNIPKEDFIFKRDQLLAELYKNVPSGVGEGGEFKLSDKEIIEVLNKGSVWALEKGYATKEDIEHTEDNGCIPQADSSKVSQKAKGRGKNQLGTIGAGNHFLEIQEVQEIFDSTVAKVFGLKKDQIVILIHTGSRGLGHQTCSDYILKMEKEYGFHHLPDRELACAPIDSPLGKDYLGAMSAAANFAFANRQVITHQIRKSFHKFFSKTEIKVVYDIAHNIAKFERFSIEGKKQTLCVHRKGATRSFGPGRKEITKDYRDVGCPILIPGSMGTFSYVLVGTKKAKIPAKTAKEKFKPWPKSSIASGKRWKKAPPNMLPAAKLTRKNKIFCKFSFLKAKKKTPTKESKLMMKTLVKE